MNERFTDPTIYRKQDEPPSEGKVEKAERTKDSEVKANLEFWGDLGIVVDEADIRREIEAIPEVKGYDWYIYIPKEISLTELFRKVREIEQSESIESFSDLRKQMFFDDIKKINTEVSSMPRTSQKTSYAVALVFSQEPEGDSMADFDGKLKNKLSNAELRETGYDFIDPLEYFAARLRWFKQNGTHMDSEFYTMCPSSEYDNATTHVPTYKWIDHGEGDEFLGRNALNLDAHLQYHGTRRVITKDTSQKILDKYHQEAEASKAKE